MAVTVTEEETAVLEQIEDEVSDASVVFVGKPTRFHDKTVALRLLALRPLGQDQKQNNDEILAFIDPLTLAAIDEIDEDSVDLVIKRAKETRRPQLLEFILGADLSVDHEGRGAVLKQKVAEDLKNGPDLVSERELTRRDKRIARIREKLATKTEALAKYKEAMRYHAFKEPRFIEDLSSPLPPLSDDPVIARRERQKTLQDLRIAESIPQDILEVQELLHELATEVKAAFAGEAAEQKLWLGGASKEELTAAREKMGNAKADEFVNAHNAVLDGETDRAFKLLEETTTVARRRVVLIETVQLTIN